MERFDGARKPSVYWETSEFARPSSATSLGPATTGAIRNVISQEAIQSVPAAAGGPDFDTSDGKAKEAKVEPAPPLHKLSVQVGAALCSARLKLMILKDIGKIQLSTSRSPYEEQKIEVNENSRKTKRWSSIFQF